MKKVRTNSTRVERVVPGPFVMLSLMLFSSLEFSTTGEPLLYACGTANHIFGSKLNRCNLRRIKESLILGSLFSAPSGTSFGTTKPLPHYPVKWRVELLGRTY